MRGSICKYCLADELAPDLSEESYSQRLADGFELLASSYDDFGVAEALSGFHQIIVDDNEI